MTLTEVVVPKINSEAAQKTPLAISFKNVGKSFKSKKRVIQALKNVSLDVHRGDIFGIIGYSGAGKSTLLRTVNGLEKPSEGEVIVGERTVAELSAVELSRLRQRIGMIFQHFNLLSSRTVFGNVAYPLRLAGHSKEEIHRKVDELLEFVGLAEKAHVYPEQLSGGQKQRVGIARALANDPEILICDEATSALDPQTTGEVLELLKRINQQYGLTVLLITHQMEVVKSICHKVAVMESGSVIEHGNVYDIFSAPAHQTTKSLVSSVLNHEPDAQTLVQLNAEGRLVQVDLSDTTVLEPFLSKVLRQNNIDFKIVYGGISHLQQQSFGSITLELLGDPLAVQQTIDQLKFYTKVRELHV